MTIIRLFTGTVQTFEQIRGVYVLQVYIVKGRRIK